MEEDHIYLLYEDLLHHSWSACICAKGREKEERKVRRVKKRKGIEVQRVKPLTLSRAIGARIGEEEQ